MSSRRGRTRLIVAVGAGLMLLLIAMLFAARGSGVEKDRTGNLRVAARDAATPERRCTSERTYDLVKQELFRSAAQLRTSDHAAFDRLSAYSALRMERPLLRSHDKELGTVRCTGTLFLDLPPGVAVVGGRRSLTADIDYILQPAADGSGDVVMLEGDGPITVPLATLARSGETRMAAGRDLPAVLPEQQRDAATEPPVPTPTAVVLPPRQSEGPKPETVRAKPEPIATPPVAARPDRAPSPSKTADRTTAQSPKAGARPSFNCRYARTRGEIAICKDAGLATLDRQMASQYYRAVASANAQQRQDLKTSRDVFLRRRDRCREAACIASSYQQRMREISQIRSRSP